jgi:hypothetical protein
VLHRYQTTLNLESDIPEEADLITELNALRSRRARSAWIRSMLLRGMRPQIDFHREPDLPDTTPPASGHHDPEATNRVIEMVAQTTKLRPPETVPAARTQTGDNSDGDFDSIFE